MRLIGLILAVILVGWLLLSESSPIHAALTNRPISAPAVDVCPNIPGNQDSVPDGRQLDESGNCVPAPAASAPSAPSNPPAASKPSAPSASAPASKPSTNTGTGTSVAPSDDDSIDMAVDTDPPEADSAQYKATGPTTKRWTGSVPAGSVAIFGGYVINGVGGGVYKAVNSGGSYDMTVQDGFMVIVPAARGNAEWCKRLKQANRYSWATTHQSPLSGWTCN